MWDGRRENVLVVHLLQTHAFVANYGYVHANSLSLTARSVSGVAVDERPEVVAIGLICAGALVNELTQERDAVCGSPRRARRAASC